MAQRWADAYRAVADKPTETNLVDLADAAHNLLCACGPCPFCDPGYCPLEGLDTLDGFTSMAEPHYRPRHAWGRPIQDTPPL